MRWVPSAAVRPHRCAFIPFIGGNHPEGFFDFGTEIMAFDGHAYCSVVAARQMAEAMGWAPQAAVNPLARENRELQTEVERLHAALDDANGKLEAIEVLKAGGFTQARKPGRPPNKARAVA